MPPGPLPFPVKDFVTQRNLVGLDQPGGSPKRALPSGSAFHVKARRQVNGRLWVQSGANHWYLWSDTAFKWRGRPARIEGNWVKYVGAVPSPAGTWPTDRILFLAVNPGLPG